MNFVNFSHVIEIWRRAIPLIQAILIFVLLFFILNFFLAILKRKLLERSSNKKHIHAIRAFTRALRYILIGFLIILALSIASDSLQQFGFTVGIFSAAIGFALQKPITGIAAWIMLIIKRPFEVGDRITIGSARGNVKEINITHVFLEEVGRYGGEEVSGRVIIIPNAKLFEENITNYTFDNKYILGQVSFTITNESNLDEAIDIALAIVRRHTDEYNALLKKEAHVRVYFTTNGMEIRPRYFVPVNLAQEIASNITRAIYTAFKPRSDIEISYQQYNINQRLPMKENRKRT